MSFWWLNPGHALHGVPDPGAVAADGTREADVVAVVAAAIAAGLRARGEQVTVRQDDDLAAVVAAANAAGRIVFSPFTPMPPRRWKRTARKFLSTRRPPRRRDFGRNA
ncbi:MAG: N-acetylmuramoyl-L-alanine amidase [Negativicoccus succinicivorans]|nr:N-acetylmuramoyl-L-alanine amidase [Negativicoccus succinicivorans]MDU2929331.1 N-acetylmuramoyl-L-alanine amidase [Negativicoccus succinicivorans]